MSNQLKDEHFGRGGSYVMVNGTRVLQARTGHQPPKQSKPAAKPAAPVKQKAGSK